MNQRPFKSRPLSVVRPLASARPCLEARPGEELSERPFAAVPARP
ncbi:hypothetical protein K388_06681 [Streptomyces sp. KhCrAH-43]|uniref:Uncharacterized protein n=1 Tax=Streptomyces tropicalis TaxID=3034234 RepID=A0ABT6AEG8_9ACTN|nr:MULTISPECIES: hypothetical protein [Streptomyces]MDF3303042.1 hypothetical protein [Streptomyces tropicalis]RAJ49763.1 hypothetical protein K388_06681 [Streptomyces sp. KhCrAH-43]